MILINKTHGNNSWWMIYDNNPEEGNSHNDSQYGIINNEYGSNDYQLIEDSW